MEILLCSDCFENEGLKLDALQIGEELLFACPNCKSEQGRKLDKHLINRLAHRFFVKGTYNKVEYGAAPIVIYNERQETSIKASPSFQCDIKLFEKTLGVGFFYYGPRFWMLGEISPLNDLRYKRTREKILKRIVAEYPTVSLDNTHKFFRIRKNLSNPNDRNQYDSPPTGGYGRLDTKEFPALYASHDLEVCIHECRVTAEDEIYVATLAPEKKMKILDLTEVLKEECTEFDSLDLAINVIFYAGKHSYKITRHIAQFVRNAGYDGIIYPSYFSQLRTGGFPYDTIFGMSVRRLASHAEYSKSIIVPNIALFGRPILEGKVTVQCVNKIFLTKVDYGLHFGPVVTNNEDGPYIEM